MNKIWKFSLLITGLIILDQLTKGAIQTNFKLGESIEIIPGLFNFTYVQNPGAAFGFLASADDIIRKPLFLFIPVVACVWLLVLIWQSRHQDILLGTSYSLILAGAVGNLIDRFSMGYVVDFLDFHIQAKHFPAFNVADSCITIAAILLIYDFLRQFKSNKGNKLATK